jgi:hypothetical protein
VHYQCLRTASAGRCHGCDLAGIGVDQMITCERRLDLKDAPCRGGDLLSGLLAKRDRAASETVYISI